MTDHIVIDVEIQKPIEALPGGWNDTHLMGVATCVVYEHNTGRFRVFGPGDEAKLRGRLEAATRISGYNIVNFDLPVIFGVPKAEWPTHPSRADMLPRANDILRRIWASQGLNPDVFVPRTHGGWKLDDVVKGTLNSSGKIANGAEAPRWFQDGKLTWVIDYCLDDVRLERDLTKFVDRFGYVVNGGRVLQVTAPEGK